MRFLELFRKQKIRDEHFRMAFPIGEAETHPLFSKYATAGEYRRVCQHIFEMNSRNPEIEDQLLDFETEGRWFCLMNWEKKSDLKKYPDAIVIYGRTISSKIAFELQSDYAMFRLFGFGE